MRRYLAPAAMALALAAGGFFAAGREVTSAAPDLSLTVTTVSLPASTTLTLPTSASLPTTTRPATTTAAPPPPPPPARTNPTTASTHTATTSPVTGTRTQRLRNTAVEVSTPAFPGWIIAAFAVAGVLIVSGLAGFVYTRSRPR